MAGIPLHFRSHLDAGALCWTRVSCFLKVHTFPSTTMTIWDVDAGTLGFLRLNMQTDGRLVAEVSYKGGYAAPDLSNTALTMYIDKWYWASVLFGNTGDNSSFAIFAQAWGPGATTGGQVGNGLVPAAAGDDVPSCKLGWGVSLSSFYAPFPRSPGNEMDCLVIETASGDGGVEPGTSIGLYPSPTGDIDPAALSPADVRRPGALCTTTKPTALYLCHELAGTSAGLADSSPNHYDLAPGPQGMLVVADGPF